MTLPAGTLTAIMKAVQSRVARLGEFEGIQFHEPKSAPGSNTAALWADRMVPVAAASGLDATSGLLVIQCRIYNRFNGEPQDSIDPEVIEAASAVVGAFVGGFTLNGQTRNVDVFGSFGFPLSALAGYINQDSTMFRVMTVQIPLVINDLWTEAE
jgi:hypothetical protein